MSAESHSVDLLIPEELAGKRLAAALARLMPEHSRTRIKAWIDAGQVQVGRRACRPRDVVEAGSRVVVRMSPEIPQREVLPEKIALTLVHEDRDVLVVDKPAGLVVHPSAGNEEHTLVNALLFHCRDSLSGIGGVARPGIVHRLDKETSGCLVVAKNDVTHLALSGQFADRRVRKLYAAILCGELARETGYRECCRFAGRQRRMVGI